MVGNMNLMLVSTLLVSLASVLVVIHGERILLDEAIEEREHARERPNSFDSIDGSVVVGRGPNPSQFQLTEHAEQQQQPDYVWELKAFKRSRAASSGGTYFSPRLGRRRKRSTSECTEGKSYQHGPSSATMRDSPSREKVDLLTFLRSIINMEGLRVLALKEHQDKSQQPQQPIFGTLLHDSLEHQHQHQRPPASFQHFYSPRSDNHGDGEESSTAIFAPRTLRDHISPRLG